MINLSSFADKLVTLGFISLDTSDTLIRRFSSNFRAMTTYILTEGILTTQQLGEQWGNFIGIPYVDLNKTLFQPNVVRVLPEDFCREHCCIPIYKLGDAVTVAMADPTNMEAMNQAEHLAGDHISSVFAFPTEIEDSIAIQFHTKELLDQLIEKMDLLDVLHDDSGEVNDNDLEKIADSDAIINVTQAILLWSVKERASDIHIEPAEEDVRVRFRIDGVLHTRSHLDKSLLRPILSRLKVLAHVDVMEHRLPLDGRISISLQNKSFDYRFSTVPTIYGEKAVLRVLGQLSKSQIPGLRELFLSKANFDKLEKIIQSPSGAFLVTGPTGSGKSTTLFSVLKELNNPDINIMTVEDPVEYRLQGVNQIQTNRLIDLDFAVVLRSFLRQDPDVILIGEIRDTETANIAAQAALTGHLVVTTMHTNSAIQAVTRLIDIGVKPFLVAPAIIGVMAQRLARRLCDNCKEQYQAPEALVQELFETDDETIVHFYRAVGCDRCNLTGYVGRMAIHELFLINDDVRSMIIRNASHLEIGLYARDHGFRTMHYDGVKKALRGLITIDEINKIALSDKAV